jgi:hypothetical protein
MEGLLTNLQVRAGERIVRDEGATREKEKKKQGKNRLTKAIGHN